METIASKAIELHIELLTTPMDLIFVSGMIEMAHELRAITAVQRAEFLNKAHVALAKHTGRATQ